MLHVDEEENDGSEGTSPPKLKPSDVIGGSVAAKNAQPSTAMSAAMVNALTPQPPVQAASPKPAPVAPVRAPAITPALKTNMNTSNASTPNLLTRLRQGNAAPLSSTPAADAIKKFIESIKTCLEAKETGYLVEIIAINANESATRLFASSVVLGVRLADQPEAAMSCHVMLLADTAEQLPVQTLSGPNNIIIELQRVVGDAFDDDYRNAVAQTLIANYPGITILDAEAEVIPAGYNYKDLNLVQATLANALTACGTILNTSVKDKFEDLEIPKLMEIAGGRMDTVARLQFNQANGADSVGNPLREDVVITYSLVTGQQQGKRNTIQSLNSGQQTTEIFKIGGFMDLVWFENEALMGAQQNQYASPYMGNQQQTNQMPWKYLPRFVITDTSSKDLATLPGWLWGLASTLILKKGNNWMGAFARGAGADNDHHDIGAIGIEANINNDPSGFGKPFDQTRSATFTPSDLHQMLTAFVRPDLVVSLDVEECGASTWQNSVFAAAPSNAVANQDIIDAANLLTGGHFANHFPNGKQVMVNDENRIHLGYFKDNKGRVLDMREIDQLCVLSVLGSSNPEQGRAWSDTFTRLEFPWEQRQHERLKIARMISPGLVVTGAARRMTFRNEFLNALGLAIVDAGLTVRPETPFMDIVAGTRGQANFLRDAMGGADGSGMFNRGLASNPGHVNTMQGGIGRYR